MAQQPKFFLTSIDKAPTRPLALGRGTSIRMVNSTTGARNADVHINLINLDSGPGEVHFHRYSENVYVVLEGEVEVVIEGERHILKPNDVGWIAPGVIHTAGNAGTKGVARVIEIYAPAPTFDDFFALDDWPPEMKKKLAGR